MKKAVVSLFSANAFAFAITGLSFIAYSRLLTAQQFGLYAVALSLSAFLTLLLDGGLKNTIIKLDRDLNAGEQTVIIAAMCAGALVITAAMLLIAPHWRSVTIDDLRFLGIFALIALVSYPFFTIPTTRMERRLEYDRIAWIESVSILIERAAPALLLVLTHQGMYSFLWALAVARILRITAVSLYHPVRLTWIHGGTWKESLHLFREGGWIQLGSLAAVLRDNLHTVLVGPFFGKEWIGYYAWALQLCLISSQVFAGISARIALPVLARSTSFEDRWQRCLYQARLLSIFTTPVLCAVWLVLPTTDTVFFHSKWNTALALVPFLFIRMLPGLATTPLGPMIMIERGGYVFAKSSGLWTLIEIASAATLLWLFGPSGLAWSYAAIVWIGLYIMVHALKYSPGQLFRQIVGEIALRPSVALGAATVISVVALHGSLHVERVWPVYLLAGILVITCYLVEREFRDLLPLRRRVQPSADQPLPLNADATAPK